MFLLSWVMTVQVAVDKSLAVMLQLLVSRGAGVARENKAGDTVLLAATRTNQVRHTSINIMIITTS
jgi:hypothetical protein